MISTHQRKQFKLEMRRNPTAAEKIFASRLKSAGIQFRHQVGMAFYIADFLIDSKMLVIELDGNSHVGREMYDNRRDDFIRRVGFRIIRIRNSDAETWPLSEINKFDDRSPMCLASAFGKLGADKSRILHPKPRRKMQLTPYLESKLAKAVKNIPPDAPREVIAQMAKRNRCDRSLVRAMMTRPSLPLTAT